jgi:DNA-binding response OmpR family regulator
MQQVMGLTKEPPFMSNLNEHLLIIEDEESIGEGLKFNFEKEGFSVAWIQNGDEGLNYIQSQAKDISIILLDLMLPQKDGFSILKQTRTFAEQVPILVLSAKSLEHDKIQAFELGADDYVTKPFSLSELILRVRSLLKRRKWYRSLEQKATYIIGDQIFCPSRLTIQNPLGDVTQVSPTEGLLLKVFLDNPETVFSRSDLLKYVWHHESAHIETRTVDMFVSKLRRYVEENPSHPKYLISIRGVGYMFTLQNK